jgi:RHS repeat-associated protein
VVKSYTYGNGLVELNTFNLDGELDTLTVKNGTVNVINRTRQHTDGQNITGIVDNMTAGNSATFAAENAGKLQNADGPWGSRTFYYDGVGNRVTELATIGTVSTNDAYSYPVGSNRLVQITRGTSTRATMTYDVGGNLLTDSRLGLQKTYTYNKRNRMATMGDGTTSYAYTYNGREQLAIRQKTTAPVVTTHFVHDIFGNVIAETSGTAAGTKREYIWLPETEIAPTREAMSQVDRPLAVVDGVGTTGIVVWNVSVDHLNRPVLMTNSAKVTQWQAVWQPWGGAHSITGPAGTAANDYRLPGQWYQLESGLHYNWHRQYDPTIGRYTQPDPLGFVDGPSVYGYAGGKPGQLVDSDGRTPWGLIFAGGDLAWQLYENGGRLECVDFVEVGITALGGGVFNAIGKGAFFAKTWGSHSWSATRGWMDRRGIDMIKPGQQRHHWLFQQNQGLGYYAPLWLKNQPYNVTPVSAAFNNWINANNLPAIIGAPSWFWEVLKGTSMIAGGTNGRKNCGCR